MNKIKVIILILFAMGLSTCSSYNRQDYDSHIKPNIIFILADDFGRELLWSYGGTSYETPALDKMATNGLVFTDTYSTPMCAPSRMMFLTGRYNFRNYDNWDEMDFNIKTIADYMQEEGYVTGMTGKWHRGGWSLVPRGPRMAGFQMYSSFDYQEYHQNPFWGIDVWQNEEMITLGDKESSSEYFNRFAIDFIKQNKDRPFFFYYSMNLVHRPFLPTPIHKNIDDPNIQEKLSLNRGELEYFSENVTYADILVKRIIDTLIDEELLDHTFIFFTSDNGTDNVSEARELFSEFQDHFSKSSVKQKVQGGKYFPTELGVNVPLLIYAPGYINSAEVINSPVDFTDMMPTFIELAGGSVEGVETDGLSFAPLLKGNEFAGREWIYSYGNFENNSSKYKDPIGNSDGFYHVISDGEWKFYSDGRLFNISKDRLEQNEIPIGYSTESDHVRMRLDNQLKQLRNTKPKIW